ncbi:MAG: Multidrug efflux protein, outer membrane component [uncultured Segetibacter sp.]|uniref:Multidrug efflux protein, outer membrane component n=1 Tax=uncultured Segetibacter sp. TaxID=481133 RepID=A0A6J4SSJ5_9BACT|nr:MAG: Multidrug efflux protein, outer membrane component [uncultured Segetibacter sp.]
MKPLIIVTFLLLASLCKAQEKIFSEEEFTAVLKKYHPVARQAELDVKIAQAELLSTRGAFDPVLKMDNARKEFNGINYYDDRVAEIKIPTWYGIDLHAGKENITGSRINPEQTKGSLTFIGFSVPLVQNLLMDKRRAALKQAKIFRELSEAERRIVLNNLILEGLKAYWDWWEQFQINGLMQAALENAEKRFKMVKTAHHLGDRPAIDTLEALTQVQSFLVKQNESYTALIKTQLELSTFLWAENQLQYDLPNDVAPHQFTINEFFTMDALIKSTQLHPELVQYQFKLKGLEINRKLKFQSLLPQFNLKYNQTGYSIGKTVNSPWFENNYRFGISFSMPLRLSEGRGEYQKARFKIDQARLEQVNKQVQLYNKVRQYYTEWQQTHKQLSVQNALAANIAALQRGEETKFFNGESSLFLINARELKTFEARQKSIELTAKNRKALISLKWSAGILDNY